MKHTPGPWVDSPNASDAVISTDADAIQEWLSCPDPNGITQAALDHYGGAVVCESVQAKDKPLIKAAPDMYAVCKAFVRWSTAEDSEFVDELIQVVKQARAAIAKVEGEADDKTTD